MSRATAVAVAICLVLVACSGDKTSTRTTTSVVVAVGGELPIVDQIDDAIAALEAKLGGPQDYFEINATPRLVNLFVALDDGTTVQPWLYFDGELTFEDGAPAQGGVLRAVDLDFDSTKL